MNSYTSPIELIDRYLQAVRFWMPRTKRQEDLLAELGEDLRSQVEAREDELGRNLEQAEVSEILKRCGAPMVVASRLGPQRYLIGPALYPIYAFVLKMVLLWMLVPLFIFVLGPINFANSGDWGSAMATTTANLWTALFLSAGIITLVFVALERTATLNGKNGAGVLACKWDPLKLPPLQKKERKPTFVQAFSELVFNVFGFVWLLLVPHHHWMVLGPAAAFLAPAPMWHTYYFACVFLAGAAIVRLGVVVARPQWAWFPLAGQLAQTAISLILLKFMIDAAGSTPGGGWYPFVILTDSVRNAPHYVKIAAVVNASILVSLACTWIGLCIAAAIQTWQLMKYLRKQISHEGQPASLQVR
jgi:hypothetical protein